VPWCRGDDHGPIGNSISARRNNHDEGRVRRRDDNPAQSQADIRDESQIGIAYPNAGLSSWELQHSWKLSTINSGEPMSRSSSAPSARPLSINIAQTYQQLKLLRKLVEQAEGPDRARLSLSRKRGSPLKKRTRNGRKS
jgi:hypothetical protein